MLFVKESKSKNNYLIVGDTDLQISYPNINNNSNELAIEYNEIIKFDYYKINSIKGWINLLQGVFPKCVYITYSNQGKIVTELIGYMDFSEIKNISNSKKIDLVLH